MRGPGFDGILLGFAIVSSALLALAIFVRVI